MKTPTTDYVNLKIDIQKSEWSLVKTTTTDYLNISGLQTVEISKGNNAEFNIFTYLYLVRRKYASLLCWFLL